MYSGIEWPFIAAGDGRILSWDFTADMAGDEAILSYTVTCAAMNGIDLAPANTITIPAEQIGNVIVQVFQNAVGGERYQVTFTVSTSEDQVISWYSYLRAFSPGT